MQPEFMIFLFAVIIATVQAILMNIEHWNDHD